MTYAQILAGGVSFQLYNKSTNAVVPTSISDGDGYIEITEDATSDHNTIYKIDEFVGAVSEITLYTEGDSAKTYALLGASQNEDVNAIRLFTQTQSFGGESKKFVFAEINGRLYIPYVGGENSELRIVDTGQAFYADPDTDMWGFATLFPKTSVEIVRDEQQDEDTIIRFKAFKDNEANYADTIRVVYREEYDGNEPWRFGQDGWFNTPNFGFIRINGVNHMANFNGKAGLKEDFGIALADGSSQIYGPGPIILSNSWAEGQEINIAKANALEDYGLTFGEDVQVVDGSLADVVAPFEMQIE